MLFCSRHYILLNRFSSTDACNLPVIKLPVYVKKHLDRVKSKNIQKENSLKKRIIYRGDTSIPVISSSVKENNYYLGQLYNEKYPIPLQSKYWFKTNSSGQKFTINPWDKNPSLPMRPNNDVENLFPTNFSELITDENILNQLRVSGFENPTGIQVLAAPKILENKHVLVASETGSGKTIAYLAPILQQIAALKKSDFKLHPETPLALIIVPGRELAEQIGKAAQCLSKNSNIDVKVLVSGGVLDKELTPYPNSNVDVLVASLGTFLNLFKNGIYKTSNLEYLVLDEADTLLDESFIHDLRILMRHLTLKSEHFSPNRGAKVIFSSSIFPSNLDSILNEGFSHDDIVKIRSPYLHKVMPHVRQKFIRVRRENRPGELLYLVKEDFLKKNPVMIFCNKSPACDWLVHYLESGGIQSVKFHGAITPVRRSKNFQAFQDGLFNVMVCTDLASRGLDTQRVKHVINFDFPNNVSDYILRAGRVGRVGSNQGRVTNFIMTAPGAVAVQEIEYAVRKSSRIPYVDSNIKQKIKKMYFSP